MPLNTSLVWFRRDLRAFDHAALHHALRRGGKVHCAFIFDKEILDPLPRADRRVAFIHACVAELRAELQQLGGDLIVRHAAAVEEIPRLAAELGVDAVFANHDYEPQAIARDESVARALAADSRPFFTFKDQVVFEKNEVLSQAGTPFSVFTPYKNAWLRKMLAEPACLAPFDIEPHAALLAPPLPAPPPPSLEELGFQRGDLDRLGIPTGMSGGARLFEDFLSRLADYGVARDYPAVRGTSHLSLHLRFGTVSIRHLARTVAELSARGLAGEGGAVWLSELIWREFYMMILYHHPRVAVSSFKPAYDAIEWESGAEADEMFAAWCEGRTGYPLVDAAMAQLNQTGYMHNRLRMVTACFLVKDLGIDWRRGEAYFALRLNDFDLAANNGGWQWASSSGCDAQPYFRIFNPVTQSQKFDARGEFIKRHLPQLKALDHKEIHAPWTVPRAVLERKGVRLGENYPPPVVAHDEARKRTLERYAVVKAGG
ncbi:cryptochrome/photolyase family protein [Pseudoduganella namucuonensis]|uniref:Deoxyribodipyrimidine photo-lyase n=1 Tax=Pseudoduganella namucuonensis TaxID=1035707 RepID=A0A1I7LJ91_9BURK|nr:deoxyribodipyrimidine photo-lyase [Pseudoduganella namucuonensis]SFV09720.1 deoxyribodipyrimidine photo-lyase [Pseudoduganella namucuonensis]